MQMMMGRIFLVGLVLVSGCMVRGHGRQSDMVESNKKSQEAEFERKFDLSEKTVQCVCGSISDKCGCCGANTEHFPGTCYPAKTSFRCKTSSCLPGDLDCDPGECTNIGKPDLPLQCTTAKFKSIAPLEILASENYPIFGSDKVCNIFGLDGSISIGHGLKGTAAKDIIYRPGCMAIGATTCTGAGLYGGPEIGICNLDRVGYQSSCSGGFSQQNKCLGKDECDKLDSRQANLTNAFYVEQNVAYKVNPLIPGLNLSVLENIVDNQRADWPGLTCQTTLGYKFKSKLDAKVMEFDNAAPNVTSAAASKNCKLKSWSPELLVSGNGSCKLSTGAKKIPVNAGLEGITTLSLLVVGQKTEVSKTVSPTDCPASWLDADTGGKIILEAAFATIDATLAGTYRLFNFKDEKVLQLSCKLDLIPPPEGGINNWKCFGYSNAGGFLTPVGRSIKKFPAGAWQSPDKTNAWNEFTSMKLSDTFQVPSGGLNTIRPWIGMSSGNYATQSCSFTNQTPGRTNIRRVLPTSASDNTNSYVANITSGTAKLVSGASWKSPVVGNLMEPLVWTVGFQPVSSAITLNLAPSQKLNPSFLYFNSFEITQQESAIPGLAYQQIGSYEIPSNASSSNEFLGSSDNENFSVGIDNETRVRPWIGYSSGKSTSQSFTFNNLKVGETYQLRVVPAAVSDTDSIFQAVVSDTEANIKYGQKWTASSAGYTLTPQIWNIDFVAKNPTAKIQLGGSVPSGNYFMYFDYIEAGIGR